MFYLLKNLLKQILTVIATGILAITSIVFIILYYRTFESGFVFINYKYLVISSVIIVTVLSITTLSFCRIRLVLLFRLSFVIITVLAILSVGLYVLKTTGFLIKFKSVESFREYISSYGNWTIPVFVLIQFLQVVVLPLPSFITVGTGTILFGAFYGSLLSVIGISLGSITAYFIGRVFGYKLLHFICGKKTNKYIDLVKDNEKNRFLLSCMFLLPFFPDDLLCFISGIIKVEKRFFIIMIIITRTISVFAFSYLVNGTISFIKSENSAFLYIILVVIIAIFLYLIIKNKSRIILFYKNRKHK